MNELCRCTYVRSVYEILLFLYIFYSFLFPNKPSLYLVKPLSYRQAKQVSSKQTGPTEVMHTNSQTPERDLEVTAKIQAKRKYQKTVLVFKMEALTLLE